MNLFFSGLYWLFRVAFYCRRCCEVYGGFEEVIEEEEHVHSTKLPWLWLGAEDTDGTLHTITDTVNKRVQHGMQIDPLFLKQVTGLQPKRWLYLNATTLVEDEFPSNGIVIE
jgi:hypothetical protein